MRHPHDHPESAGVYAAVNPWFQSEEEVHGFEKAGSADVTSYNQPEQPVTAVISRSGVAFVPSLLPAAGILNESKLLSPGPAQRAFRRMKVYSPRGGTRSMRVECANDSRSGFGNANCPDVRLRGEQEPGNDMTFRLFPVLCPLISIGTDSERLNDK